MLCPDLKNVFFRKIHWAPSEILEVKRPFSRSRRRNFGFHLGILNEFPFRIFIILSFEVVWPQRPQRPQKGLREFFQKLHFWNQCVPTKKMRYVTALWSKFSLNLFTEEVWCSYACTFKTSIAEKAKGSKYWSRTAQDKQLMISMILNSVVTSECKLHLFCVYNVDL